MSDTNDEVEEEIEDERLSEIECDGVNEIEGQRFRLKVSDLD